MISRIHFGAILAINKAPDKASGTEITTATSVMSSVLYRKGKAPNLF